jgi:hypothetical protein
MTARKQPTVVMHFTHIDHLATVVQHGLLSDAAAQATGLLTTEVGNREIKERRRRRAVPIEPGGTVADYAPFYFRAPSPMMSAIANGRVEEYQAGTGRLIYLVSTLEKLVADGLEPIITDRNAALEVAAFRSVDLADPLDDGFIEWEIIRARYWGNYPAGKERRMAECLVHGRVPWHSFLGVVTRNDVVAQEVQATLAAQRASVQVNVRPDWYL